MSTRLKLLRECFVLTQADGTSLYLVNGVACTSTGDIVCVDGGNDRVVLYDGLGRYKKSIGGYGFSHNKFREPVGVFAPGDGRLYVTDWHNHRIVILDETLEPVDVFGCWGSHESYSQGRRRFLIDWCKVLGQAGSYLPLHFAKWDDRVPNLRTDRGQHSYLRSLIGLCVLLKRHKFNPLALLRFIEDIELWMCKPNGYAIYNGRAVVPQKQTRCLNVYALGAEGLPKQKLSEIRLPSDMQAFGRLANVSVGWDGLLYVCDETNARIVVMDEGFNPVRSISFDASSEQSFYPFCCTFVATDEIAIVGRSSLIFANCITGEVRAHYDYGWGELHGVSYDPVRERFYLADRSQSCIRAYTCS